MKKRKMSVDSRVYDLAELFLSRVKGVRPEDKQELAEAIQRTCEDFVSAFFEGRQVEVDVAGSAMQECERIAEFGKKRAAAKEKRESLQKEEEAFSKAVSAGRTGICSLCKCSTWGISWCANVGCPSGFEPYRSRRL